MTESFSPMDLSIPALQATNLTTPPFRQSKGNLVLILAVLAAIIIWSILYYKAKRKSVAAESTELPLEKKYGY